MVAQVLQTAANVTMGENAAFEMLDYVISLREGIMDAWSGAILALKSNRTYYSELGSNSILTSSSPATHTIRGFNLRRFEHYSARSKQKRSTSTFSYGSYRVSHKPIQINTIDLTLT